MLVVLSSLVSKRKMPKIECHVMLDLETMGLVKNAVLTRIAAIAFNIEDGTELEPTHFNELINTKSCTDVGLKIDGDTISWWLTQGPETLQKHCLDAFLEGRLFYTCLDEMKLILKLIFIGKELRTVLLEFTSWIEQLKKLYDTHEIFVWGNGAAADIAWLSSAYTACNIPTPWKFWNERDVRTICHIGKLLGGTDFKKDLKFQGEKHNPIDDCLHQIAYIVPVLSELRSRLIKNAC